MRIRSLVLALLTLVSIAGCSSSKKSSSSSTTPAGGSTTPSITVPTGTGTFNAALCAQLAAAGAQLSSYGTQIGSSDKATRDNALTQLAAGLNTFSQGAPAEVKPSLDKMAQAVTAYKALVANNATPDPKELTNLFATLSAEGKKISDYVVAKCPGN